MTAERMPLPFGVCRTEGGRTVIEKGCLARPRRREWLAIEASSVRPAPRLDVAALLQCAGRNRAVHAATRWDNPPPGFIEADLVARTGSA